MTELKWEEPESYCFEEYQSYCGDWLEETFKGLIDFKAADERARRVVEESLELGQAVGLTEEQAHQLVTYVFSRPIGKLEQEVGGVLVTVASLCDVLDISLSKASWDEMRRVHDPAVIEKIRKKQVSKQLHGIGGTVLPGYEEGEHPLEGYGCSTLDGDKA